MGKQVVIVGGGVIGLCCAYYLQKKGHSILVLDKANITEGASFGNAGYISPSHFVPLASPGIISQGLKWMLSSSSPFYIKPRLNKDLFQWALAFRKAASQKTMQQHIPHLHSLLHLSRQLMPEINTTLGEDFHMKEDGCLMLYKTAKTELHEWQLADQAAELGINTKKLSAGQIQDMEPQVQVNVRGGVWYPSDCHLHPGEFMRALKKYLLASGVTFELGAAVKGFEIKGSCIKSVLTESTRVDCEEVIIATGSWLPELTRQLGIPIILQPGKGYSITYESIKTNLQYPAILVDHRVAMTPMGNNLRMGGTMELSGMNSRILIKRVHAIFDASRLYYPSLPISFPPLHKIWSGLRPLSPDGLPYIGRPGAYKNVIVAGGHAMLGVSLAAATGKMVQELLASADPSIDLSAFSVDRFQ